MDIKTYNAVMGAGATGFGNSTYEKTSVEFDFSVKLKMKYQKISQEEAISETIKERIIGMVSSGIALILGMACCFWLVWQQEKNQFVLLIPLALGMAPLIYASIFSSWWHKTKVIKKKKE